VIVKLLLVAGLLTLLSMPLVGPQIAAEAGLPFFSDPPAPTGAPVDPDTPPRRYAHRAHVEFQTAQGTRAGYIEDFFWSEQAQDWSYDIHSADGAVFENVLQKAITSH
jgi:hypothetical protein